MKGQFEFKIVQEPSCRYYMPYLCHQLEATYLPSSHAREFLDHLVQEMLKAGFDLSLEGPRGKVTASSKEINSATIRQLYPHIPFQDFRPTWASDPHGRHVATVDFLSTTEVLRGFRLCRLNGNGFLERPSNFDSDSPKFSTAALFSTGSSSSWWQPLHRDLQFLWYIYLQDTVLVVVKVFGKSDPAFPGEPILDTTDRQPEICSQPPQLFGEKSFVILANKPWDLWSGVSLTQILHV